MATPPDLSARLGRVRVGLRSDLTLTRQVLNGEPAYVFHDRASFQNHSFTAHEYRVMTSILSDRTLDDVFAGLVEREVLEPDDRERFFSFVVALHGLGLLRLPIHDAAKLYERYQRRARARQRALWMAPIYLKIPVWDPDAFLERTRGWVEWAFTRRALVVWAGLLLFTAWNLMGEWRRLLEEAGGMLTPANMPMLYVALVGLKALHEFGHAYTCKKFGGEVPEMGVAVIVGAPCAYVDASASWKFESQWHRLAVGMAGMYVESIIAAVFALIWISTPAGFLHDLSVNIVVLASVTTLAFNLNPLMRFDGYYVFTDLVGGSNLRDRSMQYLAAWMQHKVLGLGEVPETRRRERWLLMGFGVCVAVYKVVLAFALTVMLMFQWPAAGLLLGGVFGFLLLVLPLVRLLRWLAHHPDTAPVRTRARIVAAVLFVACPFLLSHLPVSRSVVGDGLLRPAQLAIVRAPEDGFVSGLRVRNGDAVPAGDILVELANEPLELLHEQVAAQRDANVLQRDAHELVDRARAIQFGAQSAFLSHNAETLRRRVESLVVRAEGPGRVYAEDLSGLLGRWVRAGDPLMELHRGAPRVHAVMLAEDVHRAKVHPGDMATLRWSARPDAEVSARIVSLHPAASRHDVPEELTTEAGGSVYVVASSGGTITADAPYVRVVLEPEWVPEDLRSQVTARVRFDSDARTLGQWLGRQVYGLWAAWRLT